MSKRLKVLVVGGTSGYGKGIAQVLGEKHDVVALGSSSTPKLDVTDVESIENYFSNINELDVLVYSAGLAIGKDMFEQKDMSKVEHVFNVNTLGLARVVQQCIPLLRQSHNPVIIHLGSIASNLNYVGGADYCASKAASRSFMKTLRNELLGSNIRTSSLEIGIGNTDFHRRRYSGDMEKAKRHSGDGVRMIEPEDMGLLAKFIIESPIHLNFDEVVLKPTDQASHGNLISNLKNRF